MSGHITTGKNDPSQSLQMISRPLMTTDELKALPKGNFIVTKTGTHPMKAKLELFFKWGITFDVTYEIAEHSARQVEYADAKLLAEAILKKYPPQPKQAVKEAAADAPAGRARTGNQPNEKAPVRIPGE
jgi:type IV secretion system protein VirD4